MADYRALYGMNYTNTKGNEVRVEAGDKITDMPENEASKQKNKKNIEEWVPRETENVHNPEDDEVEVHGVQSRHAAGGDEIKLKEVNE